MKLYRFRSCANDNICNLKDCLKKTKTTLLDRRIDEIVNGGLYLASPEELNDPIDSIPNLYFESTNTQVWNNLIEYIFWLCYQAHHKISWEKSNINHLPSFLPDIKKIEYEKQKDIFINNKIVQEIIHKLYKQKRLNHNELKDLLIYYLCFTINVFLAPQKQPWEQQNEMIYFYYLIITDTSKENLNSPKFKHLIHKYEAIRTRTLKQVHSLIKDSSVFINSILNHFSYLCFSKPYCACFSTQYTNSSLWGQYADGHKGLCIIYNIPENKQVHYSHQTLPSNIKKHAITKVEYKAPKNLSYVNFFENLGISPRPYSNFFYKNSKISPPDLSGEKHKEYWEREHKYRNEKTKDWAWEKEYRFSITEYFLYSLDSTKEKQKIYLNPNEHIKGIIFGYNMQYEAKQRIINEIKQAQSKNNLLDIQIYDAYFNDNREIEKRNITYLLK